GVEIDRHGDVTAVGRWHFIAFGEAADVDAHLVGPRPKLGLRIVRGRALRLIGNQKLEHHAASGLGARVRGVDLHALRWLADAACGEHALTLDLDHAGAAIAVGAVARLRRITQMRDVDALALGNLPDGLPFARGDLLAVEEEADRLAVMARAGDFVGRRAVRDAGLAGTGVFAARRTLVVVPVTGGLLSVSISHRSPSTERFFQFIGKIL